MERPMIIGWIVSIKPVLHHLIDKPSIDAFVEMRRFDSEQKEPEENCEAQDYPRRPAGLRKPLSPRFQLNVQPWKIC